MMWTQWEVSQSGPYRKCMEVPEKMDRPTV